jgi:hypothetical protein
VQQSKGGGDDNVGIGVPNNSETNSSDGNDNCLDENRNNEGGKDVGNEPMLLASLPMVTMVMVTTVMVLLTVLVAMTAIMLVTQLSVVTLLVKENRK